MTKKQKIGWFEVGKKFYCHNEILNHVVNVFIDSEEKVVVYKFWSKYRTRWYYKCDYARLLIISIDTNQLAT